MRALKSGSRPVIHHFFWGSVLGAFSGLLLWLISAPWNYTDLKLGLACVLIMGLFCGLLAGWKREKFWENAVNWLFMSG